MLRSLALVPLVSLFAIPASALPPPIHKQPIGGGGGNICMTCVDPPPPQPKPGPGKPAYFGASLVFVGADAAHPRTPNMNVRIGWINAGAATTATVQRIGDLSTLVTLHNIAAGSTSVVMDTHPVIDGQNCYRVVVSNATGSSVSDEACMDTPDGKMRPLWRAQLEVDVANVSDAGTDNDVHVRLNSPSGLHGVDFTPSGNETWIDTPGDDLEQNSHNTYELELNRMTDGLPLDATADVSDVKMITLLLDGDGDAMCVQGLNLILNETSMFHETFPSCIWVTPAAPLTVDTAALRASPLWQTPAIAQPQSVGYEMFDSLATLAVSQQLHDFGSGVSWRDTYFSSNPETWNDGQFTRSYDWAIDYHDVPLDLTASLQVENLCTDGTTHVHLFVSDVSIDAAAYLDVITPFADAIVNAFVPAFPTLFDETKDLGIPCTAGPGLGGLGLCFEDTGLNICEVVF